MSRTLATAIAATLLALAAAPAGAQPRTHGGVSADALTPAGLTRVEVIAPDTAAVPVRLVYARAGQPTREPILVAEVLVARDAGGAHAAFAAWEQRRVARVLPAFAGIGDRAAGAEGVLGFVRDNVFVSLRRLDRALDLLPIGRAWDAAIVRSPAGSASGALDVRFDSGAQIGVAVPLTIPGAILASELRVEGPAILQRTPDGWTLTRTGAGPIEIRGYAVDARLRLLTR